MECRILVTARPDPLYRLIADDIVAVEASAAILYAELDADRM
jgi:hypothetical protein